MFDKFLDDKVSPDPSTRVLPMLGEAFAG